MRSCSHGWHCLIFFPSSLSPPSCLPSLPPARPHSTVLSGQVGVQSSFAVSTSLEENPVILVFNFVSSIEHYLHYFILPIIYLLPSLPPSLPPSLHPSFTPIYCMCYSKLLTKFLTKFCSATFGSLLIRKYSHVDKCLTSATYMCVYVGV